MGLPSQKEGEEKMAQAGATFDPKMFKGNCMLFRHLNEASLSKVRKLPDMSGSYKLKKNARIFLKKDPLDEEDDLLYVQKQKYILN